MPNIARKEIQNHINIDSSKLVTEARYIQTVNRDQFNVSDNPTEIIEYVFKNYGGYFGQLPVRYERVREALPRLFDDDEIVAKHKQWYRDNRRISEHFLNQYVRQFWGRDIQFELEYKQKGYVLHGLNPTQYSYIPQFELNIEQATKLGVGAMLDDDISEEALELAAAKKLVAVYQSEDIETYRTGNFVEYLALKLLKSIPFQFLFPECSMRPYTRLRTLAESIWQNTRYQKERHGTLLIKALKELHSTRFHLKNIGWWSPIHVRLLPDIEDDGGNGLILFDILLPSKCNGGVLLDDINIANARIHGTWAMRLDTALTIHLSNLKLHNDNRPIYLHRPKVLRDKDGFLIDRYGNRLPTKRWNSKLAVRVYDNRGKQVFEINPIAHKVKCFNNAELFNLAFPNEPYHDEKNRASIQNRKRLLAVKRYVRSMEKDRRLAINVEADPSGKGRAELWQIAHYSQYR